MSLDIDKEIQNIGEAISDLKLRFEGVSAARLNDCARIKRERDFERERANEALAQLHDAQKLANETQLELERLERRLGDKSEAKTQELNAAWKSGYAEGAKSALCEIRGRIKAAFDACGEVKAGER